MNRKNKDGSIKACKLKCGYNTDDQAEIPGNKLGRHIVCLIGELRFLSCLRCLCNEEWESNKITEIKEETKWTRELVRIKIITFFREIINHLWTSINIIEKIENLRNKQSDYLQNANKQVLNSQWRKINGFYQLIKTYADQFRHNDKADPIFLYQKMMQEFPITNDISNIIDNIGLYCENLHFEYPKLGTKEYRDIVIGPCSGEVVFDMNHLFR